MRQHMLAILAKPNEGVREHTRLVGHLFRWQHRLSLGRSSAEVTQSLMGLRSSRSDALPRVCNAMVTATTTTSWDSVHSEVLFCDAPASPPCVLCDAHRAVLLGCHDRKSRPTPNDEPPQKKKRDA